MEAPGEDIDPVMEKVFVSGSKSSAVARQESASESPPTMSTSPDHKVTAVAPLRDSCISPSEKVCLAGSYSSTELRLCPPVVAPPAINTRPSWSVATAVVARRMFIEPMGVNVDESGSNSSASENMTLWALS